MRRLLLLIAAAALLAGCGAQGGAQAPAPTETTAAATTAPTETPAAAATEAATAAATETPAEAATETPAEAATETPAEAATETPAEAATETPAEAATLPARIELRRVAEGLDRPLHVTGAGDGSGRLFAVEKAGRIKIVRDGAVVEAPFLDITDRVGSRANEQGLLSVAFHPRFAENGLLFVNYTDQDGDTVVSRFSASGDAADPQSETVLLTVDQPYPNHNGGLVKFGPDGFLYIGMGDGGSGGDPQGYGQNPRELLGKLLRIDVDGGDPYAIPPDNPGGDLAPEIWAMGLRNPWRFSFDRATGDLFLADVGQSAREEVNFTPAGAPGGVNYGWNPMEGSECFRGGECDPAAYTVPVTEYGRDLGQSITGGYVYRGAAFPALQGVYLFGDFATGRIWGLVPGGDAWERAELLDSDASLASFGEDDAGELFLASMYDGAIYQVVLPE